MKGWGTLKQNKKKPLSVRVLYIKYPRANVGHNIASLSVLCKIKLKYYQNAYNEL